MPVINPKYVYLKKETPWTAAIGNWNPSTSISFFMPDKPIYDGSSFIYVSDSNFSISIGGSYDGINWSTRATGIGVGANPKICYGNGRYVILTTYVSFPFEYKSRYYVSTDGVNWTGGWFVEPTAKIGHICYGNGTFIALNSVDSNVAHPIYRSTNGIDWTPYTDLDLSFMSNISTLIYANGMFIFGGSIPRSNTTNGNLIYSLDDGGTWIETSTLLPPNDATIGKTTTGIAYGNGIFISLTSPTVYCTSSTGITWNSQFVGGTYALGAPKYITFGNGRFKTCPGVVTTSPVYFLSSTGKSPYWEQEGLVEASKSNYGITFNNNVFHIERSTNPYLYKKVNTYGTILN